MTSSQTRHLISALAATGLAALLAACGPADKPYEPSEDDGPEAAAAVEYEGVPETGFADESPAAGEDPDADPDLAAEEGHTGEPHEHGSGELSVTRDEDFLTLTLDAPLANFGVEEAAPPSDTEAEKYAEGIAEPMGPTSCEENERSVTTRVNEGGHSAMTISVVWRCAKIDRIEGLRINAFTLYPGFHKIEAVYLGPDGQQAAQELTADNAELDFD